jgi:hypothetical protein
MNDQKRFVTVTHGMSGYFAVCMWWNPDGFWEPWSTGFGRFATRDEAIEEGEHWAMAEELEFQND